METIEHKFLTLLEEQLKINIPELTNNMGWTLVSVCPFEDKDVIEHEGVEYFQPVRKFFVTLTRKRDA